MPDKDDPHNFAEHGQKARMAREYNMLEVTVGGVRSYSYARNPEVY
jgi:hypothetical protein